MAGVCEICGNEKVFGKLECAYCGNKFTDTDFSKGPGVTHRIINIELGRPSVEVALNKLERELAQAKRDRVAVLTVIHGYGASGKGGAIRLECRKKLAHLQDNRKIRTFIIGEEFSKREKKTRNLLRRLPRLATDGNLNRGNKGITVIEV